jgi:hypothetical protein
MLVGMAGVADEDDEEASALGVAAAGLALDGFEALAAAETASDLAFAAASFDPKSSVNRVSRDVLTSAALAHLIHGQLMGKPTIGS